MSEWLPFACTLFIVVSAVLVAAGWIQIARRKVSVHRRLMIWAAVFAASFFLLYVSRTLFVGNTQFGGPDHLKPVYLSFLLFHIVLATVGGIMGLITLYLGYKNKQPAHRKIGPYTSVVWFCTAITGVTVYILLYVLYPGGETRPLIEAIFG